MTVELLDSSSWARRRHPHIRDWFATALAAREIAMCDLVAMEVLRGVRVADFAVVAADLRAAPSWIPMDAADWRRAAEVQALLTTLGHQVHRIVKVSDLLIAAAAERAAVPLVHYDQHYDLIGSVTGQPMRWLVPRGTIG